jgi:hypothetical protein
MVYLGVLMPTYNLLKTLVSRIKVVPLKMQLRLGMRCRTQKKKILEEDYEVRLA